MAFNNAIISHAAKAQIVPIDDQSLDPRELMIEDLNEEAGAIQVQFAKALAVFQEKQAVLTTTMQSITKLNDDLQAAYIVSEGRNKEIEAMYQAQINAMIENEEQRSKEHLTKINKILELIETVRDRQIASVMSCEINWHLLYLGCDDGSYAGNPMIGPFHDDFLGGTPVARVNYLREKMPLAFSKRQLPNGHMPNPAIFTEETKEDAGAIKTSLLSIKEDLKKLVKK